MCTTKLSQMSATAVQTRSVHNELCTSIWKYVPQRKVFLRCPERYKTFRHTKYFAAHMAVQKSAEMCHQCPKCGNQFSRRWSLRRHEKQKHTISINLSSYIYNDRRLSENCIDY